MYEFSSSYSSVIKISKLSGFWNLNLINPSQTSRIMINLYNLYAVMSALPVLVNFVFNSIAAVTVETDNTRMIAVNFGTPMMLYDIFSMLFRTDRLHLLMTNLDSVVKTLTEDELFKASSKSNVFYKAAKVNSFFKYFVILFMVSPILTIIYTWGNDFLFQSADLIYTVPYDIHLFPFLYELTLLIQALSAIFSSSKFIAAEGLYFCLLFHLVLCLKQLRASSKFIFDKTDKHIVHINTIRKLFTNPDQMTAALQNSVSVSRFKQWIKVHNEIIRLVHELKALYSVRLGLTLFAEFGAGIFMIYSAVMESRVMLDSLISFMSWVLILSILLVPCSYGTYLTHQNSELLEDIYDKVSVCGNTELQIFALITGEVVKKPLCISVYGCTYFDLSLDTFLWMLKTVASFYVTLLQMKNAQMI